MCISYKKNYKNIHVLLIIDSGILLPLQQILSALMSSSQTCQTTLSDQIGL